MEAIKVPKKHQHLNDYSCQTSPKSRSIKYINSMNLNHKTKGLNEKQHLVMARLSHLQLNQSMRCRASASRTKSAEEQTID